MLNLLSEFQSSSTNSSSSKSPDTTCFSDSQALLCKMVCSGITPPLNGICKATVSLSDGYVVLCPVPKTSAATRNPFTPSMIHTSSALLGSVTCARPERRTKSLHWFRNQIIIIITSNMNYELYRENY